VKRRKEKLCFGSSAFHQFALRGSKRGTLSSQDTRHWLSVSPNDGDEADFNKWVHYLQDWIPTMQMKIVRRSSIVSAAAALLMLTSPAWAEGPAAGPSSQGGDKSDVSPTGVEKPLPPTRTTPDPSEGRLPTGQSETPAEVEGPRVEAVPKE
jgi:hypothetical protein